jgi:hypothetical protein
MWQHHEAAGVHHFVCGASGADPRHGDGLYRGWDKDGKMDWVRLMCVSRNPVCRAVLSF